MRHFINTSRSVQLREFLKTCSNRSLTDFFRHRIVAPYVGYRFERKSDDEIDWLMIFNGSVKCRGYVANVFEEVGDLGFWGLLSIGDLVIREVFICNIGEQKDEESDRAGYDEFCYNDSRTFNNRSYAFVDVCEDTRECLSAYRIADGIRDCQDGADEQVQDKEVLVNSCNRVRHHRFRCASAQMTCWYATFVGDSFGDCDDDSDEYWNDMNLSLATLNCSTSPSEDCDLLRLYIAASSNATLHNITLTKDLSERKITFRSYCDTFTDLYQNKDEEIDQCRQHWQCVGDEWQCYSGHCIDRNWTLDNEWDCPDASDEENMFAYPYNSTLRNYQSFNSSDFTEQFLPNYKEQSLWTVCQETSPQKARNGFTLNGSCVDFRDEQLNLPFCLDIHNRDIILRLCNRLLLSLGFQFRYFTMSRCLNPASLLSSECNNKIRSFTQISCLYCKNSSLSDDFACWRAPHQYNPACNGTDRCSSSADGYHCPNNNAITTVHRGKKQSDRRGKAKQIQVALYPSMKWNQSNRSNTVVRKSRNIRLSETAPVIPMVQSRHWHFFSKQYDYLLLSTTIPWRSVPLSLRPSHFPFPHQLHQHRRTKSERL